MCGRFVSPDELAIAALWGIVAGNMPATPPREQPRYNVAPQQGNPGNYIPVVRENERGEKELSRMQWWLLPVWSKARTVKFTSFIATIERAREAPAFRDSLRFKRCIIPALGWYEWQELKSGNLPWYLKGAKSEVLNFAGLWASWSDGQETIESCAIMVGPANASFWNIHDRMPFILDRHGAERWLDRGQTDPDQALALLQTNPDDALVWHRVSRRVNKATEEGPELIEPIDPATEEVALATKPARARKPAPAGGPDLFSDEPPF